jgi:hypothetical protein
MTELVVTRSIIGTAVTHQSEVHFAVDKQLLYHPRESTDQQPCLLLQMLMCVSSLLGTGFHPGDICYCMLFNCNYYLHCDPSPARNKGSVALDVFTACKADHSSVDIGSRLLGVDRGRVWAAADNGGALMLGCREQPAGPSVHCCVLLLASNYALNAPSIQIADREMSAAFLTDLDAWLLLLQLLGMA